MAFGEYAMSESMKTDFMSSDEKAAVINEKTLERLVVNQQEAVPECTDSSIEGHEDV